MTFKSEWQEKLSEWWCQHEPSLELSEVLECVSFSEAEAIVKESLEASREKEAYYIKLTEIPEWEVDTAHIPVEVLDAIAEEIAEWEEVPVNEVKKDIPEYFFVNAWHVELVPIEEFLDRAYRETEKWGDWYWVAFTFWLPERGLVTIRNRPFVKVTMKQLAEIIDKALKHPEIDLSTIIEETGYAFEVY